LGPKDGTPVSYSWHWYYHFPQAGLWLIVVSLLFLGANRKLQAWLILAPLVGINVVLYFVKILFSSLSIEPFSSISELLFSVLGSLALGFAALWILSFALGNRNRFLSLVLAAIIMAAVAILGTLLSGSFVFAFQAVPNLFLYGVSALAALLGLALAGAVSRRRFSARSFMMRLPLWTILVGIVEAFVYIGVILALVGRAAYVQGIFSGALIAGVVVGALSYLILLPFMALTFSSKFYRNRFNAVFRL
jgi:hypothetical protein